MFPLKHLIDALLNIVKVARDPTILDLKNAIKPTRTSATQEVEGYVLEPGSVYEITKSGLDTYSGLVVIVNAYYDLNASKGVRIRWLYSPDGTVFDTEKTAEQLGHYEDLALTPGEREQGTIVIPIFTDYIIIQIVNLDSTYSVIIDVWTLLMR